MKFLSHLRLRTQMALAMITATLITLFIGYYGLNALGAWQSKQLEDKLPSDVRSSMDTLRSGKALSPELFHKIEVLQKQAQDELEAGQNIGLFILWLVAASLGASVGILLARQLTRPLEALTVAASQVAEGDLTVRVSNASKGAGEIPQLIQNFNQMAEALQAYEREYNESNAAIAHELRTPLMILMGRLQGIKDGLFPGKPKDMDGLLVQVEALSRIVEDLRILSLVNTKSLELKMAPMDLASEIEALLPTLRPDLDNKAMRIEVDLQSVSLEGDATRLRQAAMALVDNAARHAKDGQVVRIETRHIGKTAILRIMDRGPGLNPEDLKRVFERFWRSDSSRSREFGGSGLGLSVVAAIASAHNGEALAQNRDGGGAVFEIHLPARKDSSRAKLAVLYPKY